MNNTLAIELPTRSSGLGHRIRTAIASAVSNARRELTREEVVQLHENRLVAERLVDDHRMAGYAARIM
jgi:hypothetical protein